jgi:hypothetical protein
MPGGAICVTENTAAAVALAFLTCPVGWPPCSTNASPAKAQVRLAADLAHVGPRLDGRKQDAGCVCQPIKPPGSSVNARVETSPRSGPET